MLMMFYLNVFYLPTLKDFVGHYKLWNEVMFWFTTNDVLQCLHSIDLFAVKSAILKVGQTPAKHAGYSHTFPSNFRACDTYCSGFVAFSTSHSDRFFSR